MSKADHAEAMTSALFNSQGLLESMQEHVLKEQTPPLAVAFAMALFSKMMRQQIPDFDKALELAYIAVKDLEDEGVIGDFQEKQP